MGSIQFRMAARCEKAGRPNNEDNFHLASDLSSGTWGFNGDEVTTLSEKGCLMVVADGMGGMNAGEVASSIAVETVKAWFSPERLAKDVTNSPEAIKSHIAKAIIAADAAIKEEARRDAEKEGMGSTIVVAWIIGASVYIGWCGDSRAYRYNPAIGLKHLSRDHSYVQELIDSHKLDPDMAFDHPNSNIITRSLGDSQQKARPEVEMFPLYNGDAILLCSDGLSGVLRDREIEALIAANGHSMSACLDALWSSAEQAGWHDNVTVELCQVISGCRAKVSSGNEVSGIPKKRKSRIFTPILALVCFLLGSAGGYLLHDYYLVYENSQTEREKLQERQRHVAELRHKIDSLTKVFPEVDISLRMRLADILTNENISDLPVTYITEIYSEINKILQSIYRERNELERKYRLSKQAGGQDRQTSFPANNKNKDKGRDKQYKNEDNTSGSAIEQNQGNHNDGINPVSKKKLGEQ
ncbi:MAG: protein phosphatase 2C domain-containing protein [Prevotellaceae bacterium]|nr:protein phosphatase 2C domain-containing protein [Prevotellaceae bacterium]